MPSVVNYRVANGHRDGIRKTNEAEARAIVALLKACIEQPEYEGKTFGIISLLGDEQVKVIQRILEEQMDAKEMLQRKILCGNSANFQGDERDVVFLSLVDSGNEKGPLRLVNFGPDDAYRKRYNVAASRAKDQLWVVDSLDPANDLKPGDLRKILIDYSINPHSSEVAHAKVEEHAESPFEAAVATTLVDRGYHLVQQWEVGAYRLDIVAVCGKKAVAIECDGERWHSGEAKIREDMERQTILERLGWRFIRIRGSEYYRNPESTMDRVISELASYGIEPESAEEAFGEERSTELLSRVKSRAETILFGDDNNGSQVVEGREETIGAALNSNDAIHNISPNDVPVITISSPPRDETIQSQDLEVQENDSTVTDATVSPSDVDVQPPCMEPSDSRTIPLVKEEPPEVTVKESTEFVEHPVQMVIKGMDILASDETDVFSLLQRYGVEYIDKRSVNGNLWIIGGNELKDVVKEAKKFGLNFKFKKGGGKLTKGKDAWWAK